MRIRRSLRLYILGAMLLTGIVTIAGMSVIAMSYFFSGLDIAMVNSIRSQALRAELIDNQPLTLGELTVASRWEDLPEIIKQQFPEDQLEANQLGKFVEGYPLLTPPKAAYFAMKIEHDQITRYASIFLSQDSANPSFDKKENIPHFLYIMLAGLAAILLFLLVLIAIIRSVSTPVENLREWAKSLDQDKINEPVPNFQYSELNALAGIIQSSLSSVQKSLEREKQFLGYASHELRTPIAVTRTNTELLTKMISKDVDKNKQTEVLGRIERAVFTMTDLTETLLWLNRQEDKTLPEDDIAVGHLVEQINQELSYLLNGKQVKVKLSRDDTILRLPTGLCRIVITNLIRNAYQHTCSGEVEIIQSGFELCINNQKDAESDSEDQLGFGLGLELTERLIKQYNWRYEKKLTPLGRIVTVSFD